MSKKSIIIVGGAGYIGTIVIEFFLKKNYQVVCVDNLIYNQKKVLDKFLKNKNFTFFNSDLRDNKIKSILNKKSNVLILAGLVGDPITKKYKKLSQSINYVGIKNLIITCNKKKINRLIFVSTCSNYGIGSKKLLKEDDDLKPLSYYSKQKVKIEQLLIKIKKVNFIWTILRFATAFGVSPRMRFDLTINHFVKSLLDKEQLEIYDSQTFRPYCHVKDFARAIKKIMSSNSKKINNVIFNVGSNRNNFSKRKIYDKISKHIKNTKVRFLKKGFDKRDYVVNFKKINKVLNFKTIYSVDYGIREIIKYVKQNYKENKSLKNFGNYKIRKLKKII